MNIRILWAPPVKASDRWSSLSADRDASSAAEIACWHGNALRTGWPDPRTWPVDTIVARSGSIAEGDDPFAEDPSNWMPSGRHALETSLDRLVGPLADSRRTLLLRPHVRQVLSDLAGSADFLRRHRGERFGLALAPADLVAPSMLGRAEDLLVRAFEVLVPRLDPSRDVLVLQDLEPSDDPEALPVPVPFGTGGLPWECCRRFAATIPSGLRIVLDRGVGADALLKIWG